MTRIFLRVYFQPDAWIGPGKIQLLEGIRDHGSISAAGRAMEMSYRRAWLLVDSVNRLFREPAVRTLVGGRRGGAATLTPFGHELIRRYHAMEAVTRRAIARHAAMLERRVRPSPRRRRMR